MDINSSDYNQRKVSIDFGGSLQKYIFLIPRDDVLLQNIEFQQLLGQLQEIQFKSGAKMFAGICNDNFKPIDVIKSMIKYQIFDQEQKEVCFTGGASKPFIEVAKQELGEGWKIVTFNEYVSLSYGLNVYLKEVLNPVFKFIDDKKLYQDFTENTQTPKLLLILGTAMGIQLVQPNGDQQLVGGSPLGGGSLRALIETMTGVKSYQEAVELAIQGDRKSVDFTFGDTNDPQFSMFPQDMVIYNFVKLSKEKVDSGAISKADIIRSLYHFVIGNSGYTLILTATLLKMTDVFVAGNFLNQMDFALKALENRYGMPNFIKNYYHLSHSGHLTAIGVLLKSLEKIELQQVQEQSQQIQQDLNEQQQQ